MSNFIDENKQSIEKLVEIGLSEKEAAVYLALLPYRDIGSSKLIRATGLHGQFVYNALDRLESLGLAKHVMQNGRKKFTANTPNRLLSLIEEKRYSAQAVAKQLQQRFVGAREQDVEIFQGDSAFVAHQFDLYRREPDGSTILVLASESEQYRTTLEREGALDDFFSILREKKLKIRYIGAENQRPILNDLVKTGIWDYRILPGHATGLVDTDIWHDNITLNIFGDPVLCITITGKAIADGYRQFFDSIWALSQK